MAISKVTCAAIEVGDGDQAIFQFKAVPDQPEGLLSNVSWSAPRKTWNLNQTYQLEVSEA